MIDAFRRDWINMNYVERGLTIFFLVITIPFWLILGMFWLFGWLLSKMTGT